MCSDIKNRLIYLLNESEKAVINSRIRVCDVDRCLSGINIDQDLFDIIVRSLPGDFTTFGAYFRMVLLENALKTVHVDRDNMVNSVIPFTNRFVNKLQRKMESHFLGVVFAVAMQFEKRSEAYTWDGRAVEWALEAIANNAMGDTVRNSAAKFLAVLIEKGNFPQSLLIPQLVNAVTQTGDQFLDFASGLLNSLRDHIPVEIYQEISKLGPKRVMYSAHFCKLIAAVMYRQKDFSALSDGTEWHNPKIRLNIMKILIEQGASQLVPLLMAESQINLGHFVVCYSHLSAEEKAANVDKWIIELDKPSICSQEHIKSFLFVCAPFSIYQAEIMFIVMEERFAISPVLVKYLMESCPIWARRNARSVAAMAFAPLRSGQPTADDFDWAFQIFNYIQECVGNEFYLIPLNLAFLRNEDKFLRVGAIKFLGRHALESSIEQIVQIVISDVDVAPRSTPAITFVFYTDRANSDGAVKQLAAMTSTEVLTMNVESSARFRDELMRQLLLDRDPQVREKLIVFAEKLMKMCDITSKMLKELLEDRKTNDDDEGCRIVAKRALDNSSMPHSAHFPSAMDIHLLSELLWRLLPSDAGLEFAMDCF